MTSISTCNETIQARLKSPDGSQSGIEWLRKAMRNDFSGEQVFSHDGAHIVLTTDQCKVFRKHIAQMDTAALESTLSEYDLLCARYRSKSEIFVWKQQACRDELARRQRIGQASGL